MPKIKPIVAGTPEDLAHARGLPRVAAKGWQFQHVLLARLKEITRRRKITHSEIALASRYFANQGYLDPEPMISSMYRAIF